MTYFKRACMLAITLAVGIFMSVGIARAGISGIVHVEGSIQKVLDAYTSDVKQHKDRYRLLLIETAVVESDLGEVSSCMGNYGHYQIRGTSGKELLSELRSDRPDIYQIVMRYHRSDLSLKDNLIKNLDFSTALCVAYYCTKIKNPNQLSSLEERAATWKRLYNTPRGAGTVSAYIRKNKAYGNFAVKNPFTKK